MHVNRPPRRRPANGLTLHQRRVLEAWQSSGDVTLAQIARLYSTTASAVCRTLRVARAKIYGHAAAGRGKRVRLLSLSICFV